MSCGAIQKRTHNFGYTDGDVHIGETRDNDLVLKYYNDCLEIEYETYQQTKRA